MPLKNRGKNIQMPKCLVWTSPQAGSLWFQLASWDLSNVILRDAGQFSTSVGFLVGSASLHMAYQSRPGMHHRLVYNRGQRYCPFLTMHKPSSQATACKSSVFLACAVSLALLEIEISLSDIPVYVYVPSSLQLYLSKSNEQSSIKWFSVAFACQWVADGVV